MKYMIMHYASQANIDAANVAHGLGHGSVGRRWLRGRRSLWSSLTSCS